MILITYVQLVVKRWRMSMRISNTQAFGFKAALRAMRNPLDSWDRADTEFYGFDAPPHIGFKDLELARKLIKAGGEHRKFIRLIQVWATLELPRYIWSEFDTYKVGMTRMSCSTMHKLGTRDLAQEDFAEDSICDCSLKELNALVTEYKETKNYNIVRKLKRKLPEGYIQRADVNLNYETAFNMYKQRNNHRLEEWQEICDWLLDLPHFKALIGA